MFASNYSKIALEPSWLPHAKRLFRLWKKGLSKEKKHIVQTLIWGVRQRGQADYLGFIWRMSLVSKGISQSGKNRPPFNSHQCLVKEQFSKNPSTSSRALLHLFVCSLYYYLASCKLLTLLQVHNAGPLNNLNNESTFS